MSRAAAKQQQQQRFFFFFTILFFPPSEMRRSCCLVSKLLYGWMSTLLQCLLFCLLLFFFPPQKTKMKQYVSKKKKMEKHTHIQTQKSNLLNVGQLEKYPTALAFFFFQFFFLSNVCHEVCVCVKLTAIRRYRNSEDHLSRWGVFYGAVNVRALLRKK